MNSKYFTENPSAPIEFILGDLWSSENPLLKIRGDYSHMVHAATPNLYPSLQNISVQDRVQSTLGIERLIDFSSQFKVPPKFVYTSSGAVYGNTPQRDGRFIEQHLVKKMDDEISVYRNEKIATELIVSEASNQGIVQGSNPRLFTFFGPGLLLDSKYAIGNFVLNGHQGREIIVKGNAGTRRSYLYPTDLVSWLIASLMNPTITPLHIGSELSISMENLANTVSKHCGFVPVKFTNEISLESSYVPETKNSREFLGVFERVNLQDGISRWLTWLKDD